MENVCRVCTNSTVTLVDIFTQREQTDEELCLAEILNECVHCNVRADDSLPKLICLSCILDAQNAFHFKRRCEQSHQHFCELLTGKDNGCENFKTCKMVHWSILKMFRTSARSVERSLPLEAVLRGIFGFI